MENSVIIENPKNLQPAIELYCQIFDQTIYEKTSQELLNEWNQIINDGGKILIVEAEEFDYPFGIAILKKDNNTLLIQNAGVKEEFRNQGVWSYLYSFIEHLAEEGNYNNLAIQSNTEFFPQMAKFISENHFKEVKKIELINGYTSIIYSKSL